MSFSFKSDDDSDTTDSTDDSNRGFSLRDMAQASYAKNTVDGDIKVSLSHAEMENVLELAKTRNKSYEGKGEDEGNTVYGDDNSSLGIHVRGIKAELALAKLFEEASIDLNEYEHGDDGLDSQLRLDGELLDVDVKSVTYPSSWLQAKQKYVDSGGADAYVVAYTPEGESTVIFKGWMSREDIQKDKYKETSPYDVENYTVKDEDKFRDLPEPDSNNWHEV